MSIVKWLFGLFVFYFLFDTAVIIVKKRLFLPTKGLCTKAVVKTKKRTLLGLKKGTYKFKFGKRTVTAVERGFLSSKALEVGQEKNLYYSKTNPKVFTTEDNMLRGVIVNITGIVVFVTAMFLI